MIVGEATVTSESNLPGINAQSYLFVWSCPPLSGVKSSRKVNPARYRGSGAASRVGGGT
jgi:hypothetical protein